MKSLTDEKTALSDLPGSFLILASVQPYTILYAGSDAREFLGQDPEGKKLLDLVNKEDHEKADAALHQPAFKGIMLHLNNGAVMELSGKRAHDAYNCFLSEPLLYSEDPATGLMGHSAFQAAARRKLDEDSRCVYIVLYIGGVNDYGMAHDAEERDRFLAELGRKLMRIFEGDLITRSGVDHFVIVSSAPDYEERIRKAGWAVQEMKNVRLVLKAGIADGKEIHDVSEGAACARVACDMAARSHDQMTVCYSREMREALDIEQYTGAHIDEALQNGWIKVYYQPLVRTINRSLCGAEALTRWIDPVRGFLSPASYIHALEQSENIYKLDSFVIQEVCRNIRYQIDHHGTAVPVSLNLSRLDFVECDIFQVLEDAVRENRIARDMVTIEITESVFARNEKWLAEKVAKLRDAGYQVWMDDFGSEYSSLHLLKGYHFDLLKMDLDFMRDFNDVSRQIVRSITDMAKRIGIHTLCEGVETEEQFAFLQKIGCEKVQGYLFGKPVPYEKMVQQFFDHPDMNIEQRRWRPYYEKVGMSDFLSNLPFLIVEKNRLDLKPLFINDNARVMFVRASDPNVSSIEDLINSPLYSINRDLCNVMDRIRADQQTREVLLSAQGTYQRWTVSLLAAYKDTAAFRVEMAAVTETEASRTVERTDKELRNIISAYEDIRVIRADENEMEVIKSSIDTGSLHVGEKHKLKESIEFICSSYIYPEDEQRYRQFMDPETMNARISARRLGVLVDAFRFRSPNNNYHWKLIAIVKVHGEGEKTWLACIRPLASEEQGVIRRIAESRDSADTDGKGISDASLWHSLVTDTDAKMFWKDDQRRFLGASQAFLTYYHLSSAGDLIGRTDDEMGWHVDNEPFRSDEWDVIEEGKRVVNAKGTCIVNGTLKNIVANKMPLYVDGRIAGLIGYFEDADEFDARKIAESEIRTHDALTGLMNIRGFLEARIACEEEYHLNNRTYVLILLDFPDFRAVKQDYDNDTAEALLKQMADVIRDYTSVSGIGGRLAGSKFAILRQMSNVDDYHAYVQQIVASLNDIHSVNGCPVTVQVTCMAAMSSERAQLKRIMQRIEFGLDEDFE